MNANGLSDWELTSAVDKERPVRTRAHEHARSNALDFVQAVSSRFVRCVNSRGERLVRAVEVLAVRVWGSMLN